MKRFIEFLQAFLLVLLCTGAQAKNCTQTSSNLPGKFLTAEVVVNVVLSCNASPVAGTVVKLQNSQFPLIVYTETTTTSGTVIFPGVIQGTYDLTVTKFGYDDNTLFDQLVTSDITFTVTLQQQKTAPSYLFVNNKSLKATWTAPSGASSLFSEAWNSGSFATNGWTAEGNWMISGAEGNPAPSAMFSGDPAITGYDRSLTSKTLTGGGSPELKLMYDIFFSNIGGTLEEMEVEYQVGGAGSWLPLKHYDNTGGDIPWTTETFDLTSIGTQQFKIRFRAHGVNSSGIYNWNVDNITIQAITTDPTLCVIAYHFYLNNTPAGYSQVPEFMIPPNLVTYGTNYIACVRAEYASGYSNWICCMFTSRFLYPPQNLQVQAVAGCIAALTWEKPLGMKSTASEGPAPGKSAASGGLIGYKVYRDNIYIAFITDPDILFYNDSPTDLVEHAYTVKAWYDLTNYGYPAQYDESVVAGPVSIDLECGDELPFCEEWQSGDFAANGWTVGSPANTNWSIDPVMGNPAPSADFSGQPPVYNYELWFESPVLDGWPFSCAELWANFDYKLEDNNPTGAEKLEFDLFFQGQWINMAEIVNSGDQPWTPMHIDISQAKGRSFKIRFRAEGVNSADILHWFVDNICIYAEPNPPGEIHGESNEENITLSWHNPQCGLSPAMRPMTSAGSDLLGYNIYRSDDNQATYNKVNASVITDTAYIDVVPYSDSLYWYFVTAVYQTYGSETAESDSSDVIPVNMPKSLSLKLLIESLYAGSGTMNQASDEFGPHFDPGIADQIAVELHNGANYAEVKYTSGLVYLSTDGVATITGIPFTLTGFYYIAVIHRNSILTVSANPVSFAGNTISYDFTTSAFQAFGDNLKYDGSKASGGYYLIWAGDVNQDGIVDAGDMNPVDNASTSVSFGYVAEDVNGDGIIDAGDMNIVDNNSTAVITAIVP